MKLTMTKLAGGARLCTVGLTPTLMVGAVGCCPCTALMGAAGLAEQTLGSLADGKVRASIHPQAQDAMRALKVAAWVAQHPGEGRAMLTRVPSEQARAIYTVLHRMGVKL